MTRRLSFHHLTQCVRALLLAVVSVVAIGGVRAQTAHSIDSLKALLARATTPADSVVLLHNLYDCTFSYDRKPVLYQIFETAERAKDYNSMLGTLFVLTSGYQHEPALEGELLEMAKRIPESDMQKAHVLYIKLRYQATNFNRLSETERQQKINQTLKDLRNHSFLDDYDRMACLFLICSNLRNTTDSKLLLEYLQQLQALVEKLPQEELPVRSLFYRMSIDTYIENEMFDKALAANKRMFELIGQFDKLHESQGRIFRNYDGSLYHCYHNMLVCASELTDDEIEMYHNRILDLIASNEQIRKNRDLQKWTEIYYLMAKKRYAEVVPLIKDGLKSHSNNAAQFHYANMLIKAAGEVGDSESLLLGSKIVNSIYRERLMARPDVRLSELQTIFDVENLKDSNRDLNFENQRMEVERRRQGLIAVAIAVLIAGIVLVWLISLYVRSRRLGIRLTDSNKTFTKERNSHSEIFARLVKMRDKAKVADVTKSNFVKNMSGEIREPLDAIVEYSRLIADYGRADERSFIREYSNAMSVNTDLLIRLVNDILDLPRIESGQISIQRSYCSVNDICTFALEVVKRHVSPGVKVNFVNTGHADTIIFTDSQRVEQVLIQVLTNAAKFTHEGSITFGYELNPQEETITFTVTDTGIGLPFGVEERIFERFVKMDPTSQGSGLGLYIGRLLATMLDGTLMVDPTYRSGARFLFTIPIREA